MSLLVVAALAAHVVGCGDDDSAGSASETYTPEASTTMSVASPPVTKQQFIAEINEICRYAWPRIQGNVANYRITLEPRNPRVSKRERVAETVGESLITEFVFRIFDSIRIFGSPPGEQREIEEIIGPMQAASELGQKGRPPLYSTAEISEHYREYNQRAHEYGLDKCVLNMPHLQGIWRTLEELPSWWWEGRKREASSS